MWNRSHGNVNKGTKQFYSKLKTMIRDWMTNIHRWLPIQSPQVFTGFLWADNKLLHSTHYTLYCPIALRWLAAGKEEWLPPPFYLQNKEIGVPGWLSQLSVWVRLRSWYHGSWVRAPRQALCWQPASDSVSPSLSLPLPYTLKNKH